LLQPEDNTGARLKDVSMKENGISRAQTPPFRNKEITFYPEHAPDEIMPWRGYSIKDEWLHRKECPNFMQI
jgi:hypothetical protein